MDGDTLMSQLSQLEYYVSRTTYSGLVTSAEFETGSRGGNEGVLEKELKSKPQIENFNMKKYIYILEYNIGFKIFISE